MYVKELFSWWVISGLIVLGFGILSDVTSTATNSWGRAVKDTYYTDVGLFKICNGTREVTRRDKLEIYRLEPSCYFPGTLNLDWFLWTMGMECLGLLCALCTLITMVAFLISLRCDYLRSRSALVAVIPCGILSACFNTMGLTIFAVHIGDLDNSPSWSFAFDVLAVLLFITGTVLCILDLQGCLMKRRPTIGKGLTRPI